MGEHPRSISAFPSGRIRIVLGKLSRFTAGLAVDPADGSVACWEDRRALGTTGIDLWCSNGAHLERPGDQRWPTMSNGYLLWREGEQVLTARLR